MRKQQVQVAIPCQHCSGVGYVENPIYRGQQMRALRLKARLTLTDIAHKMLFSKGYLSDLELGRRAWSESLIADYETAIAKVGRKNGGRK